MNLQSVIIGPTKGIHGSKGRLTFPGRGMSLDTILATEFQSPSGFWYRVEIWKDQVGLHADSYRREGGYWMPYGSQEAAMIKRSLLSKVRGIE